MRTAFFILLAANLAFWGWSLWLAPSTQDLGSFAPKLPRIMLASEMPPPVAPPARCVAIGPFAAPDEVAKAGRILEQDGYQPSVRVAKADVASGYLVIASGIASAAAQARTVARLRRAGFRDAAARSDATDGMAVIVGSYSDLAGARSRAAAAERAGVAASVMEQTRRSTVFWLEFALKGDAAATPESLQASLGGGGNALKVEACEAQPPVAADRG